MDPNTTNVQNANVIGSLNQWNPPRAVCPCCGRCPSCGHVTPSLPYPSYPYVHYYYPYPHYTYTTTMTTTGTNTL